MSPLSSNPQREKLDTLERFGLASPVHHVLWTVLHGLTEGASVVHAAACCSFPTISVSASIALGLGVVVELSMATAGARAVPGGRSGRG
jgi:hypothetical protein